LEKNKIIMSENNVYCIIKELILRDKIKQSVIMVNSISEILEYDNKEEAEEMAKIFTANSDSGWNYYVREIGFK